MGFAMAKDALPPLNWLRAFEAAARHLSFTLAAQELNLTQSAISQHVRSLENFLGQKLFIRDTRALRLSVAGSNYLPTVREAFDILAIGTRSFVQERSKTTVTLQCNMSFSAYWIAPRLQRLIAAHPSVRLDIINTIWDTDHGSPRADIEIRFGRASDMSDAAIRLGQESFYPVCSPKFAALHKDWQEAPLFDCAGVLDNWDMWLKDQNLRLPDGAQVHSCSTYLVSMTAAQHGAGFALSHDSLAQYGIERGDLVRPFEHKAAMVEGYYLLPPPTHGRRPAVQATLDWMMAEFEGGGIV